VTAMLTRGAAEEMLFHEAMLLDEARYDEWLALYTLDCSYWVPCRPDQPNPLDELSLVFDDYALMQARVAQITHPAHYSNIPGVRASRHISNVHVTPDGIAHSKLLMVLLRNDQQEIFAGRVTHQLRHVEGALKIAAKKIVLLNCDSPLEALLLPL
jgi:3-phenylpropionate/cinnamic acid dioxygenase small subunit